MIHVGEVVESELLATARRELVAVQDGVTDLARKALDSGRPEVMRAALELLATSGELARHIRDAGKMPASDEGREEASDGE